MKGHDADRGTTAQMRSSSGARATGPTPGCGTVVARERAALGLLPKEQQEMALRMQRCHSMRSS